MKLFKTFQVIFDSSEQVLFQLSTEQQSSIDISRNEIKSEQFFRNEGMA